MFYYIQNENSQWINYSIINGLLINTLEAYKISSNIFHQIQQDMSQRQCKELMRKPLICQHEPLEYVEQINCSQYELYLWICRILQEHQPYIILNWDTEFKQFFNWYELNQLIQGFQHSCNPYLCLKFLRMYAILHTRPIMLST